MMWTTDDWTALGSVASAAGSIATAVGIWYARVSLRHSIHATEISVIESILRDIREMDRQYILEFATMDVKQKTAWAVSYFHSIEYLCFLRRKVPAMGSLLSAFFPDSLITHWRAQYDGFVAENLIHDADGNFSEFKSLCLYIRSSQAAWAEDTPTMAQLRRE